MLSEIGRAADTTLGVLVPPPRDPTTYLFAQDTKNNTGDILDRKVVTVPAIETQPHVDGTPKLRNGRPNSEVQMRTLCACVPALGGFYSSWPW